MENRPMRDLELIDLDREVGALRIAVDRASRMLRRALERPAMVINEAYLEPPIRQAPRARSATAAESADIARHGAHLLRLLDRMIASVSDLQDRSVDLVDVLRAVDCGCDVDAGDCDCPVVDAHHSVLAWGRARERARDERARDGAIDQSASPLGDLSGSTGRIVRIMPLGGCDPGGRLRLELNDGSGLLVLSDENVLPEQVGNPDARRRTSVATIDLTTDMLRWIVESGGDLLREIEGSDRDKFDYRTDGLR
jgi:hypothetical protein